MSCVLYNWVVFYIDELYLIYMWHMGHDSYMYNGKWLVYMSHMGHDAFICDIWDMTHLYVIYGTWLIYMWYMGHDSFKRDMDQSYVPWHKHVSHDQSARDMSHRRMYVSHSFILDSNLFMYMNQCDACIVLIRVTHTYEWVWYVSVYMIYIIQCDTFHKQIWV